MPTQLAGIDISPFVEVLGTVVMMAATFFIGRVYKQGGSDVQSTESLKEIEELKKVTDVLKLTNVKQQGELNELRSVFKGHQVTHDKLDMRVSLNESKTDTKLDNLGRKIDELKDLIIEHIK